MSWYFFISSLIIKKELLNRMASDDNQEFETKKRIREQLIKEGIIA